MIKQTSQMLAALIASAGLILLALMFAIIAITSAIGTAQAAKQLDITIAVWGALFVAFMLALTYWASNKAQEVWQNRKRLGCKPERLSMIKIILIILLCFCVFDLALWFLIAPHDAINVFNEINRFYF